MEFRALNIKRQELCQLSNYSPKCFHYCSVDFEAGVYFNTTLDGRNISPTITSSLSSYEKLNLQETPLTFQNKVVARTLSDKTKSSSMGKR
ncbi:hypothetical protein CEXT_813721 [Caerostris extrusa]|uniref:Uncharacterized protein n=1 Tax=Caerostris extrusa TaxID=172846 RepID=A0AAV4U488_CAEEX|nr:hypothetical protein CEXT_813721 [Caerostris extrusa]